MSRDVRDWGTRLGDKMRRALADGDAIAAWQLALQGDGQARDLAREYAFMIRGLCVTLDVLLRLLLATAARHDARTGEIGSRASRADSDLGTLLLRLLAGLGENANGTGPLPETDADAEAESGADADPARLVDACLRALQVAQQRSARDQLHRADEIVRALADGDTLAATTLLDAKDLAYLALHDLLVRFMADSFAWVLCHFGTRALLEFHLATAEGQRAGFEKWEQLPADEFAAITAYLLRQHMGQVQVEEDERRFTIRQPLCGSGGRLRIGGAYDGERPLPFVEEPGPLTFDEPRMPVYCTHCAIWNGSATLRWFGRAQWVFEQPARADGSCTLHIYKRREDAPVDYTRRVGVASSEGGS